LIEVRARYYTVAMNGLFDHEKLTVYQDAIRLALRRNAEKLPENQASRSEPEA